MKKEIWVHNGKIVDVNEVGTCAKYILASDMPDEVTVKQLMEFCEKNFVCDYAREYIYAMDFIKHHYPNGIRIVP